MPRSGTFVHRGSVVASHLFVADNDILDPDMLREKSESDNPIMSVLKEMVDFEIMLNPLFVLICISNILGKIEKIGDSQNLQLGQKIKLDIVQKM